MPDQVHCLLLLHYLSKNFTIRNQPLPQRFVFFLFTSKGSETYLKYIGFASFVPELRCASVLPEGYFRCVSDD